MTQSLAARHYSLFGLKVCSAIELPELHPCDRVGRPDVSIVTGHVADTGPGLSTIEESLILGVEGVARYRVMAGKTITVDADPVAPARNVRLFLLGSAFGALLHQRGLLPLHANAVEIEGKAVAFMGPSGAGKSTLAAWFHDVGHRIIADDVCVVGFDPKGGAYASPGLPRLRLWAEALKLLDRDAAGLQRSYIGDGQDKFDVPIPLESAGLGNRRLAAIYLLDRGDAFAITPLRGIEAADAIFANTYRGAYLSAASGHEAHWSAAMRLLGEVPIYKATRKWDLERLADESAKLRKHAQSIAHMSAELVTSCDADA